MFYILRLKNEVAKSIFVHTTTIYIFQSTSCSIKLVKLMEVLHTIQSINKHQDVKSHRFRIFKCFIYSYDNTKKKTHKTYTNTAKVLSFKNYQWGQLPVFASIVISFIRSLS